MYRLCTVSVFFIKNKLKMCYEWIRIFLISAKADGEIVLNALLSDIELRSVKADRVV